MDSKRERKLNLLVTGLTLAAIPVVAVAMILGAWNLATAMWSDSRRVDCENFEFEPAVWRKEAVSADGRERQAAALVQCKALIGLDRRRLVEMLGDEHRGSRDQSRWTFAAGWVNDGIGPGDGQELIVEFAGDGSVARARLLFPAD